MPPKGYYERKRKEQQEEIQVQQVLSMVIVEGYKVIWSPTMVYQGEYTIITKN